MISPSMPAWAMGQLTIGRAALEALERDVRAHYLTGEEACGYLCGPAEPAPLCDEVVPLANLANKLHRLDPETFFRDGRTSFAFDERTFDAAVRRGSEAGRPVKVLYHSHLDTSAYFSATDAAVLSFGTPPARGGAGGRLGPGPQWSLAFLVTSVHRAQPEPRIDAHKVYVWRGNSFAEACFEVVE